MKSWHFWVPLVAVALVGAGSWLALSEEEPAPIEAGPAGTRAVSRDESLTYEVDADAAALVVKERKRARKVAEVKVGRAPARVVVSPDDSTVYVSNRGGRSVSVIKREGWREEARIPVGVEPEALAVTADGSTLLVANRASLETPDGGSLTAVDTRTLEVKWDLPLGDEPRGLELQGDGKALVTLEQNNAVVAVDLNAPRVDRSPSVAESAWYLSY